MMANDILPNGGQPTTAGSVPRIVSVFEDFPSQLLQRFANEGRIKLVSAPSGLPFSGVNEWLLSELTGADAVITWPYVGMFGGNHIAAANADGDKLKIVSTCSVGTEAIDRNACRAAGVKVGYTPYIGDDSIAEYTIAMLLHYCRRLEALHDKATAGGFLDAQKDVLRNPTLNCGFSPSGKVVGFYGFGRIAQKTAEKLLVFGVSKILYTTSSVKAFTSDRFPRLHALREAFYPGTQIANETDLHTMASQADILIILCPGNASTSNTINAGVFDKMKPTSVVLNVARGTVLVNEDLEHALRSNQISAALLDVIQGEPHINTDHPLLAADLRDRVLILPHAASSVVETRSMMADITARNILTTLGFEDELLGDKTALLAQQAWTHFAE
ncbi:D-isomer specific 2-hydroxyacid dehydrogenase, NAD-binding [Kalmanozyma brasiliensis GHG001]|uniref:Glyoxylate/hydroxypyruvate reductase n=1 Tax=Kalmanozyma brasiliensis (strain GHG001) TaxID=1365824 RepID=V5EF85_KALBG|nr:D-isomer specific 2-hydroxyacid dehydrogenase, NAD-binding [Kalmanozyma brasiliensis GHG001]EST09141.1 D-isomer specific 2-hydroxyacid dehydrogenase, NAD-binding [Kalmanozyma brasiliensis GHG001]